MSHSIPHNLLFFIHLPHHYAAAMADIDPSQNGPVGPILADDLMRDRSRQFTEFLDDQVGPRTGM